MKKHISILLLYFCLAFQAYAQDFPFQLHLKPITIAGMGGLQSFAVGQHDGKWLIVGGRLDGLHRRQPFAAFDVAGHNQEILVVDPESRQTWKAGFGTLSQPIKEQLAATNMEFWQEGDYLYLLGGYGYSTTLADHTTFASLIAIHVPGLMQAVVAGTPMEPWLRQISDPQFQVTGGRLRKIGDVWHLLGGQKFLGLYNPMGPTHGPGFVQEYTNQVRRFRLQDDGTQMVIEHLTPFTDSTHLHRRDYNAEAQILPDGSEAVTMFSGVFRTDADLPYLYPVTVDAQGIVPDTSFLQYYNHYHCAAVPMYASGANQMHTVFFGGIAQYYEFQGTRIKDDNVPFVKTIAVVTRDAQGKLFEQKLPVEMPGWLGAGSEFIANRQLPHYANEVLKLDEIQEDSVRLGYIYGGIHSTAANIFFVNTGTESSATSQIFEVVMTKGTSNTQEPEFSPLGLQVFPNPSSGAITIEYQLEVARPCIISLFNLQGVFLEQVELEKTHPGKNSYYLTSPNLLPGKGYIISVKSGEKLEVKQVVVTD